MIPTPRPGPRFGDCPSCGRQHTGECYLSASVCGCMGALEEMERNREVPEATLLDEMTAALETVSNAAMPTHIRLPVTSMPVVTWRPATPEEEAMERLVGLDASIAEAFSGLPPPVWRKLYPGSPRAAYDEVSDLIDKRYGTQAHTPSHGSVEHG